MHSFFKPLFSLTAEDLMSRDLIMIPQAMSFQAAARLLAQAQIHGAPVVDAHGTCMGVISSSDLVRWSQKSTTLSSLCSAKPESVCSDWQMVVEELPTDEVGQYMNVHPITVDPRMPITDLARQMITAHIHRLIVVDDISRPIGIVTSTDILAALAYAELGAESSRKLAAGKMEERKPAGVGALHLPKRELLLSNS